MWIEGTHYRSIWLDESTQIPQIIDQTLLPFRFSIRPIPDLDAAIEAIRSMRVRGAPLIGATAAHGLARALAVDGSDESLARATAALLETRPTAVNLRWALVRMNAALRDVEHSLRAKRACDEAIRICDEDVANCESIGEHGLGLIKELAATKSHGGPLQLLTHCNAGWLATVDWGTALAPIFKAHEAGIPLHVWVGETRPRNQGSSLTAFELREQGIPHTVIVDNAGGHLMQTGRVDAVFVGSDRATATGDVCNKIGTYLKALAADANDVPFYVALPISTIDWEIRDGLSEIVIEERAAEEVREITGIDRRGQLARVSLFPAESPALNPGFDVTPARYVTALVTEKGVFPAREESIRGLRVIT